MSEKSTSEVIQGLITQAAAVEGVERRSIPWDNVTIPLVVINAPIGIVRLNPHSHRIRAQISAHPKRKVIEDSPFSDEAQGVISSLLEATEGFEDLKTNLKEVEQREPGVITREGVLVNANTRAVALRKLGMTHIKVMVLPPGATPSQINELELRLQVARDYRQDYSFTNRLLFIKDCFDSGWDVARIAREAHGTTGSEASRVEKVRRDLRLLTMIEELIDMSDHKYGYPDFDNAAVAIEELDRDYEDMKGTDADAALRLRAARQVAILCGVGYRNIRFIGKDFVDGYLKEEIQADANLEFLLAEVEGGTAEAISGLDLLGASGETAPECGETLLIWLAETAGQKTVKIPGPGTSTTERSRVEVVEALQTAIEKAVETVRVNNQRGDLLKQPKGQVDDAIKRLRAAQEAYKKAATDPRFSGEVAPLRDSLATAERGLHSLRNRINSDFPATPEA